MERTSRRNSDYYRVRGHMLRRGCCTPATGRVRESLEMLVRRCDEVRGLREEYGEIELSPYMRTLLRVSGVADFSTAAAEVAVAGA
ncbi:MAG: hypothetical protein ABSE73_22810 [Planctomycetota bacterium]